MLASNSRRILRSLALQAFIFLLVLSFAANASSGTSPRAQRMVLSNGLVVLVAEDHSLPMVVLQLLVDAGSRLDPSGKEGLAHLASKGLLLGTAKQQATAIHEAIDFMGASLSSSATRDVAIVALQVLKKDLEKGFGFFVESLTAPLFPGDELQKELRKIIGAIQASDEQPMALAEKTFQKTLFANSPYGHPVEGTRESVEKLTRKDVSEFYKTHDRADGSILSIVGDITLEEVKTKLVPLLEQWPSGTVKPMAFNASYTKGPRRVTIDRQITQANIVLGAVGVRREDPDYYSLSVLNYILGGGGFSSRLMEEIRVKKGLAYSVSSFFDAEKYQGSFQIVMQTKNETAREAIALAIRQMELIRSELVSDADLKRAKAYLTGSFPLRVDTQSKLAAFLAQAEYYGLGLDYPEKYPSLINRVQSEDVLRAAKAHMNPQEAIIVVIGNLKEAGMGEVSSGR